MQKIHSLFSVMLLISILNILALGFKIQNKAQQSSSSDLQNHPKIPSYIGTGYHILVGNPFSNHVDQGFRVPIFNFTYTKNQTTQDEKYLIPDYTHSMQSISCSIQSKVSQFTGTKNYQKQLQNSTKFDTRLSYSFLSAAFTYSRTFQQFSNQTTTNKQTSFQSNAQCHVYSVDMPLYSNQIPLSNDFIQGVRTAYAKKQWQYFIDHFGTHFASTVIYGGRYLLQHTYKQYSMSLFTSMKLDINMAAKIQYLNKIGISLSQDMKKYQNQTNLINQHVQTTRLSTVGGLPPKSGDWNDWVKTVKQNLAPVGYHLTTLSVLFNFIHSFDAAGAIKSYQQYLNTYCLRNKCPPLTPQRPDPKPLVVSFAKLSQISGVSKSSRTYDTNDGTLKAGMRINKVLMGSQGSIDSIQFFLSDGIVEHALPVVGDRQFNHQYLVPKTDQIKCIRFGITYNGGYWKFTSMQFVTRSGVESEVFTGGYKVNQYRILCVENSEEHFIGFYGRYGNTFDSVGFNVMKENMQN